MDCVLRLTASASIRSTRGLAGRLEVALLALSFLQRQNATDPSSCTLALGWLARNHLIEPNSQRIKYVSKNLRIFPF